MKWNKVKKIFWAWIFAKEYNRNMKGEDEREEGQNVQPSWNNRQILTEQAGKQGSYKN